MTRSLSNVIKAAAITYTQEKRTIDSNGRAEQFTRLFVEKHAQVKEEENSTEGTATEFELGIPGLFADRDTEDNALSGDAETAAARKAADEEAARQLKEQAEAVLEEAREEVNRMLAEAEEQAKSIREKAYADAEAEGYREGERKAKAKYEAMQQKLEREVQTAKDAYEKQVQELEPAFADIVIRLLKKLTGVLVEDKRGIIVYLLEQALTEIEPGMDYLIHVSAEDFELVNNKKNELLWKLKEGAALEVTQDQTLHKGQCIIETDSRIFDCSLDTQLKNLVGDLKLLAGCREE